jgi:hypothetical protein
VVRPDGVALFDDDVFPEPETSMQPELESILVVDMALEGEWHLRGSVGMAAGVSLDGRIELTGIAMTIAGPMALETAVDREPGDRDLLAIALWGRKVDQLPGPVSDQCARSLTDSPDLGLEAENRALAAGGVPFFPDPLADPSVYRFVVLGITAIKAFAGLSVIIGQSAGEERNRELVELVQRERWRSATACRVRASASALRRRGPNRISSSES